MGNVKVSCNCNFMIEYLDDFNHKHITIVRNFSDIDFYKERFSGRVSYFPVMKGKEVREEEENSFSSYFYGV